MSTISRLDQRRIEAAVLGRMYETLCAELGQGKALELIRTAVEKDSFEAGRTFAATAPEGPSLEHFLTITDNWVGTGAIDIGPIEINGNTAHFPVTKCRYVETYRDMGLPEKLLPLLSCARDEPFAKGYSERLSMVRPETIAGGFEVCGFVFVWK